MNTILKNLTEIPSACGFEYDVIRYLRDRLKDKVDHWEIDGLGNLIVRMDGGAPGPVLVASAHTDEVGFMVQAVMPNGLLKILPIGGWVPSNVPAHTFIIKNSKL